jgi:hypothetical protein
MFYPLVRQHRAPNTMDFFLALFLFSDIGAPATTGALEDQGKTCPLSGVKWTSKFKNVRSAFDPKQTWHAVA